MKEKFVILLVKKMLGWDRGADDDLKMEEGVNHWARFRFAGGGRSVVHILTMCKEGEETI